MSTAQIVTATLLAGLAVAHSTAGETGIIRPLLAAQWTIDDVPRWAADRLLRIAWHLTSMAWLALAVVAVGGSPLAAISVMALASGLVMLAAIPGHPAWPAFLLAGLGGLHAEGWLTPTPADIGVGVAVAMALALAGLHVYWLVGGTWLLDSVVPTRPGSERAAFTPGRLATAAVVVLLLAHAGLVTTAARSDEPWVVTAAVVVAIVILSIRAIGDGRQIGFSKRDRSSRFSELDDRWFTPIVTVLAITSGASLF